MDPALVGLLIGLVVVGAGVLLGLWLSRLARRWAGRRTQRRGHEGERRAVKVLRRAGYRVEELQVTARAPVVVDGRALSFEVRADAVVTRRHRRYVAEFKTGNAASVANRQTRRQLLEYATTFDADGLLLVDATRRTIVEVEFPALATHGVEQEHSWWR